MKTKRKRALKDYTGKKMGMLTVLGRIDPREDDTSLTAKWAASCICGAITELPHKWVSGNKKKNCGCGIRSENYQPGKQFAKLTIVKEGPPAQVKGGTKRQVWCSCSCGNPELTLVATNNLISGNTTSCGCVGIAARMTHGKSSTRTYSIWEAMIRRCKQGNEDAYPRYAGRGIKVCDEWNSHAGGSFENFLRDMGEVPEGLSLDRINYDLGYYKENCRWATSSVQGYNKPLDPNNTSGKSGVSFYTREGKWSAEIHVNNEHIRLGYFDNKEDAIAAREAAELKYYGWNKE